MNKLITILFVLLAVALLMVQHEQASANTYAHNVRITQPNSQDPFDGRFDDGSGAAIRFVLADRADSVVINIKLGATLVRTLRGTAFVSGDSLLVWDGMNNNGQPVGTGDYSVQVTAYDQGYAAYTQIYYNGTGNGLSTRGVTTMKNPNLKNFGFVYGIDNAGYLGTVGILRLSGDGRPWGDVKGNPKVNNTGIVLGPGEVRWSPEADADGYVYVISYTQRQLLRFHTDTLSAALVDSGFGGWYINGLAIKQGPSGKLFAMTAKNASGTTTLGTDSRILSFQLNPGSSTHFGSKDTLVSSQGQAIFWDVVFGRDSVLYATFNPPTGSLRPGIAKFNLAGKTLPLTMADTSWTVTVDSGRGNTATYYFGNASDGSEDVLYFTIARVASGNPPSGQGIYAITNLNASQPLKTFAYPDIQNNLVLNRSDVAVDAVGNIVYFENNNEEIALISPPTGPNSYTLNALSTIRVIQSESITAVRVDANGDFVPDRLGQTVTVVGIVNGVNLTASANRFSYSIQDATAGIVITKASQTGGGTVYQVGDRVAATGTLGQFNGTAQIDIVGDLASNVILLDQGNAVVPITLTIDQRLANPETYESMLIKINNLAKLSGTWPASGNATLTMWDGFSSLAMFMDLDTDIDGTPEAVYPVNVVGVATQFTSATPPNTGYQISPRFRTDFTEGVQTPPNPHFALLTPANNSTVFLDSTAQTVEFKWRKAVDLNNDPLIYQWVPVGFTAVSTGSAATDTFLVRTGQQLFAYMGTADTVVLRWSVRTKDTPNPIVNNVDTFSVRLVNRTVHTRNVTFVVNTATVPDSVGTGYNVQIRGSKAPLTWGSDTGGALDRIGGDYWSKTLAFTVGDTVRFKIFVGVDGWEQTLIPDPPSLSGGDRAYIVAGVDTVLPVQFFNNGPPSPQYFRPWTEVADTFMNVYFRTNMLGAIQGGLFGFNNNVDTVGVRGGGPAGGDLNWSPTFYLVREHLASNGGTFGLPANTFWSGRVRIPKSGVSVGQTIDYKFLIGYDWGRDELQGQPNRNFNVPIGKLDTTIYFSYFNNTRPIARTNDYSARVTFRANMQKALSTGGFAHGDTLVVRSGYFGTSTEPEKQKRMTRVGVSTIYTALDTVITAFNQTLDYQYYIIPNVGDNLRESYYNFFYTGDVTGEAERRQLLVPDSVFTINDTSSSITQARRQPIFPNTRTLARTVTVRWEVDIRPAWYQVAAGDTLNDIQGSFSITHRDSVYPAGTSINGLATGGWQTWGFALQADTTRKMWDDGTHGDQVAGDSIFTRIIVAAPESLGIGTKGQVGQIFKFGLKGGDNEGGRGGFGNNHSANIDDSGPTFVLRDQWGSINPAFYNRWDYDNSRPRTTGVEEISGVPQVFELKQNYPNPFNPATKIEYTIPTASFVTLKVYNVIGQEVATLVNEHQRAAKYVASFDGKNLASGVYFYKLTAGQYINTQKMLLLK